jgi:hypothetical protein
MRNISKVSACLKDDTARMNDRIKNKQVTGQMIHQTADQKANASVFLFFPNAHFLKTILASRKMTHLVLPHSQADSSCKSQRAVSANALTDHSDNKTDFLRILTNYKL